MKGDLTALFCPVITLLPYRGQWRRFRKNLISASSRRLLMYRFSIYAQFCHMPLFFLEVLRMNIRTIMFVYGES